MDVLLKYFPIVKVDESAHMVWGIVTSETPDSDEEICDYPAAKAAIKAWSDDQLAKTTAAGQDPSLGNMRVMHQLQIGGKAVKIEYRDDQKQVWVGSEPVNEEVWHLLKGGFLTGHSIGGSYDWKRTEGKFVRYAPTIGEISYVDKGANPDASFAYVKADGVTELRKFVAPGEKEKEILRKMKEATLVNLSDADVERLTKAFAASLDTHLEKMNALTAELVGQLNTSKGAMMKPEEIKKCAAALGISEDEFVKLYVPADALVKAKKGLAALHGHMEAAMSHHEAMHKAHTALGSLHDKMGTHLGKCMKSVKDVMGSDEAAADKAIKDLLDELLPASDAEAVRKAAEKKAADDAAAANGDKLTKADAQKLVDDAVTKAKTEFEDGMKKLTIVPRTPNEVNLSKALNDSNPYPV